MRELIYLTHDNSIDLVLMADGAPVSVTPLTGVLVDLDSLQIDSAVAGFGAGQPIDTTRTQDVVIDGRTYAAQSYLRLTLGSVAGVTAGRYHARLTVFDVDHPNGLVWTEALGVVVRA